MPARFGRIAAVVVVVTAIAGLATATTAGAAKTTPEYGSTRMRGARYCELLLLTPRDGQLIAQVWNTYQLNDCPEAAWAAVDTATVARDENVALVLRNGPRYWLIDKAERTVPAQSSTRPLSGLPMRQLATVALSATDVRSGAYREQRVVRNTTMTWPAGKRVYELTSPDGAVYVMQSWSQQIAPTLTEADLRTLGDRLTLPAGFTFGSRVLRKPLSVGTDASGAAFVLQDELMNAYSRRTPPPSAGRATAPTVPAGGTTGG